VCLDQAADGFGNRLREKLGWKRKDDPSSPLPIGRISAVAVPLVVELAPTCANRTSSQANSAASGGDDEFISVDIGALTSASPRAGALKDRACMS